MKLHTLQQFIRSLVEPLAQTGSTQESLDGLRRACDLLVSFGDINVSQFADLMNLAREYESTKQIAIPASIRPFVACFDSVRALKARVEMPEINREELTRDLLAVPLDSLELNDLLRLTADLGIEVKPKAKKVNKADAIDAVWQRLMGQGMPKAKKAAAPRTSKPKVEVNINEYAQKINELKERATAPDASREELERSLDDLNLDKLSNKDIVAVAKQLACDVNARTKKPDAIDAVRRVVLEVKEMMVAGAG